MASLRVLDYDFFITSFCEFAKKFNIANNELANAENLNASPNQVKREFNQLFGLFKVLTSSESILWRPCVIYQPGEIVSYYDDEDLLYLKKTPTQEQVMASYYLAVPNRDNYNKERPNVSFYPSKYHADVKGIDKTEIYWKKVTLKELFPLLDYTNFAKNTGNDTGWDIKDDYDVIYLKYLKEQLDKLKKAIEEWTSKYYIQFDNRKNFNVKLDTHVTTKKYVDTEIKKVLEIFKNYKDNYLQDYVYLTDERKMRNKASEYEPMKTPNVGLLPGVKEYSTLGNANEYFKAVYALNFYGEMVKVKCADLCEIYESDKTFDVGTLIGLNENGYQIYEYGKMSYIGVVSHKPALILNHEKNGIPIALQGQTPVKVQGAIKLGEYIRYSNIPGVAVSDGYDKTDFSIGIALESSEIELEKLINCKIV